MTSDSVSFSCCTVNGTTFLNDVGSGSHAVDWKEIVSLKYHNYEYKCSAKISVKVHIEAEETLKLYFFLSYGDFSKIKITSTLSKLKVT